MELKHSKKADAVADLYRAAFYLATGSKKTGIDFLKKAHDKIGKKLDNKIVALMENSQEALSTSQQQRYWAEKILDQYHKLRISLM